MDLIEALLELIKEYSQFVKVLAIIWLLWGLIVFFSLKHKGEGRDIFLQPIKKQSFEKFYLKYLKQFLNFTSKNFFYDFDLLENRRKDNENFFNTFTDSSYVVLFRLSLFYPTFFVIFVWFILGQGGEIGSLNLIVNNDSFIQRAGFILGLSLIIYSLWMHKKSTRKPIQHFFYSIFSTLFPLVLMSFFINIGGETAGILVFLIGLSGVGAFIGPFAYTTAFTWAGIFVVAISIYDINFADILSVKVFDHNLLDGMDMIAHWINPLM